MLNDLLAKNQSSDKLYVEDVFSTWLYTGTGASQTITNGIDLAGKGGLVWLKERSPNGFKHDLFDTARGYTKQLSTNETDPEYTQTFLSGFNSNGFGLNTGRVNSSGSTYASWTFRKAPKFFDVVTWSGNSTNRTISHSLGSVPGMIIVKRTDSAADWQVYHRSLANTEYAVLNTTAAKATGATRWNSTTATDTVFSLGTDSTVNATGGSYVAYLFAHDTTSDGVIQCGSFTTDGSGSATVNLGYEPQFILVKASSAAENWNMFDVMRGMPASPGGASRLSPNTSSAESGAVWGVNPTATGFTVSLNASTTYIYMAIRRGPMRVPTDATKVFSPDIGSSTGIFDSNFPVDLFLRTRMSDGINVTSSRLQGDGTYIRTYSTGPEGTGGGDKFDSNTSLYFSGGTDLTGWIAWLFRRAPGFVDVVCYTAGSASNRRVAHNLSVPPELIINKCRSTGQSWYTYSVATGRSKYLALNETTSASTSSNVWGATDPTSTDFGINEGILCVSGATYVTYLFASCPGVSKVGSYTGTGTTKQIDCGFTNGARFVLIKRTDSTGDWYVYDSARGIVSGNDPYLLLNSTAAEVTNTDYIDPLSTGFELSSTAPAALNANGGTYIYLAIA